MAARGVAPRPLTLRDFLELACDSSSDGFRSYPRRLSCDAADDAEPVRLRAELGLLRRSPSSRSPSSLFSLPGGPGALARISSLSRSFSRRIKEGFWRRRDDDSDEEEDYFDDRDSCGFPSPLVSSCSVSDDEADVTTPVSDRDSQATSTSSSSSSSADHDRTAAAADGKKMQALAGGGDSAVGRKLEDQQQLSPVSVLDFPFDDDDGEEGSDAGTCSPAFQRCTPPDLQKRTKQQAQLLHKIRRYDGDGVVQGIEAVDLDARFTAATSESGESMDASTRLATTSCSSTDSSTTTAPEHDDEAEHQSAEHSPSPLPLPLPHQEVQEQEAHEYRLLARLLQYDTAAAACLEDEVSRVLLLDFFAEGADRLLRSVVGGGSRPLDEDRSKAAAEKLVRVAAEWLHGMGPRWGIGDVVLSGKAALDDMERSRRWMCVNEEERDIGADVEGAVVDALVDELLTESWCCMPW